MSSGRKYTAKELSELIEVSPRQIRTYIEELEKAGIYVDVVKGRYGGYYYQSGGFVAIRSNPLWLVRAGSIGGDGSLFRGGEWSEYASSTIINDFASFTELEIGYEQNAVLAISMLYKYRSSGYSIRCIAE